MARFGFFCLPWIGHLNPLSVLARELERRGHETVFFHLADLEEPIRQRGLRYEVFGEKTCPAGTLGSGVRETGRLAGGPAMAAGLSVADRYAATLFAEALPVVQSAKLDGWVVDQLDYAANSLAAHLGVPFVTVALALMRNHEDDVPGYSGELPSDDPEVRRRNDQANQRMLEASRQHRALIEKHRKVLGVGDFRYETIWSEFAQITQQPAEFEFPRRQLPESFHFTGPFVERPEGRDPAFPWERLDGRPIIYVSFGTVQNRNEELYEMTCEATALLNVQVVLSLGGTALSSMSDFPGDPIVVPYAPQLEILQRADLMVTHAGMNSTLECLTFGVPMVALPIAHDQFGTSARMAWSGTGLRLLDGERSVDALRCAIEAVLTEPEYRLAAQLFAERIKAGNGLARAADIVENVAVTGQPVLRES